VISLPATGRSLTGTTTFQSVIGHHRYAPGFRVTSDDGTPPHPLTGAAEAARLIAAELAAADPDRPRAAARQAALCAQIADSAAKCELYLERRLAEGDHPAGTFLTAEQGLLLGHPFHPAAKASEGFGAADLDRYAPELRASFPLHWLAVAPDLMEEHRLDDRISLDPPAVVASAAADRLAAGQSTWPLLPCHPWQAAHLGASPDLAGLIATGRIVALGPLGPAVSPTSSVRTVWDRTAGRFLKLPLGVRITNFVRVNPPDQLRRSLDVSRVIGGIGDLDRALGLERETFRVLLELGFRTLAVDGNEALASSTGVIYREATAWPRRPEPMVVAALLERSCADGVPALVRAVGRTGTGPASVRVWLGRYLELSLVPLARLAARFGVSLEAHSQNSLVVVDGGWPVGFWVRDLEGGSLNREHVRAGALYGSRLREDSPALYSEAETWHRFAYYVLVNHLGQLIAVLAEHLGPTEEELWEVVHACLTGEARRLGSDPAAGPLRRLLEMAELPAKANLTSRFAERSEEPLYVGVPNPLRSGRSR
jgi:siderophore synthetase component